MKFTHDQYRVRFKHKIRTTLFFYYFFPVLVAFAVLGFSFYWISQATIERELGLRLQLSSQYVASHVQTFHISALKIFDSQSQTYQSLEKKFQNLIQNEKIQRIYILDADLNLLFDSDPDSVLGQEFSKKILHQRELLSALNGRSADSVMFKKTNNEFYKSSFSPIWSQGNVIGISGVDGSLHFFQNLEGFFRKASLIILFCLLLVALLSFFLSRKILTPVLHLVRGAQEIGEGKFNQSLRIQDQSELGFLAFVLDEMRKKILERDQNMLLMLRGIAHEIRNPLGGMELFAGILGEHVEKDKEKNAVKKIQNEIQNLKKTVDDFTHFAKDQDLDVKDVELAPFFDDIRELFSKDLSTGKIKFRVEIEGVKSAIFDPIQLQRVFLNLIRNSMDAMPEGGKISIHVRRMGGNLNLILGDNGQGMDREQMKQLFQPFYTSKAHGNGLGLALVKKIILAHGGQIEMSSTQGQGTEVSITLPWR